MDVRLGDLDRAFPGGDDLHPFRGTPHYVNPDMPRPPSPLWAWQRAWDAHQVDPAFYPDPGDKPD